MDKRRFREPVSSITLDLGGLQASVLHGIDEVTEEFMSVFLTPHPEVFIQGFEVADDGLGRDRMTGIFPTLLLLLLVMVSVVVALAMTALPSSCALARVHIHDQVTHKA
jgi:hypothetical protein